MLARLECISCPGNGAAQSSQIPWILYQLSHRNRPQRLEFTDAAISTQHVCCIEMIQVSDFPEQTSAYVMDVTECDITVSGHEVVAESTPKTDTTFKTTHSTGITNYFPCRVCRALNLRIFSKFCTSQNDFLFGLCADIAKGQP